MITDPDSLNLTKDQIKDRIKKIENNISNTKEGKLKAVKFKLVFGFLNWMIDHYDLDVLNKIFMGIIKEFDELRYSNALEGNIYDIPNLDKLKQIQDNKVKTK